MGGLIVSARGEFDLARMLVVNTSTGAVETFELSAPSSSNVPAEKRGTMGLVPWGDGYVTAGWGELLVLNARLAVCDVVKSPLFSDLHGMALDGNGLLIASTNLDGVLRWEPGRDPELVWTRAGVDAEQVARQYGDLGERTKDDLGGLYRWHVNDVARLGDGSLLVSHLGPAVTNLWVRAAWRRTGRTPWQHAGGLVHISSNGKRRVVRSEGLHDLAETPWGLASSEYFGHALRFTDPERLSTKRVPLAAVPDLAPGSYLTRGVWTDGETLWVGRTVARGQAAGLPALLERYEPDGGHCGDTIELPGIKGPYAICAQSV